MRPASGSSQIDTMTKTWSYCRAINCSCCIIYSRCYTILFTKSTKLAYKIIHAIICFKFFLIYRYGYRSHTLHRNFLFRLCCD